MDQRYLGLLYFQSNFVSNSVLLPVTRSFAVSTQLGEQNSKLHTIG